jgi:putative PEP-CTERM system histidine kinase
LVVTAYLLLPVAAGILSLLLAAASLPRGRRSPASWCFLLGMTALGLESLFTGLRLRAVAGEEIVYWLTREFVVKSCLPGIWLCFSLTYSRSNYSEFLTRWRLPLVLAGLLPVGLVLGFHDQLFQLVSLEPSRDVWGLRVGATAKALNIVLLVSFVMILMNLEQTFRSAVGTMRWRIKFVVVALAVIFGARLYVRVQAILFPASDIALWSIESVALLIGCLFLIVAYTRTRLAEIDVYPSLAVLRSSLTILIVGGYLFIVGVLAQVAQRFGGGETFQFQALVVLLGMAGLAVLLLSDRARQRIHAFVGRHFSKAQHDSVRIWTMCSQRLSHVRDRTAACDVAAKLISETFDVLSVTIWLVDEERERLVVGASTARQASGSDGARIPDSASESVVHGLRACSSPFDLEMMNTVWAEELRQLNPPTFTNGGNRLCVPLRAGEQRLGVIVMADRVNGRVYTVEELELLKCLADQTTSVLLNHLLTGEVAQARELEAFRTMSVFFVHDLKNAAASLNLMLKNLPVHFNDPAFRDDALRAIGNTARRIDEMIARLSTLRERPNLAPTHVDLNHIVSEALDKVDDMPDVQLTRELHPLPRILVDREQIQNVVTNLVLNARDALGREGRIQVRTEHREGRVLLSVTDNGCGMSPAFVKDSLFRPFQSTKKKGLGIGLFQSRAVVQAHGGAIHVQSEVGRGTTLLVSLPVTTEK